MNEFYVYIYLDPRKLGEYIYEDLTFDYEPFYVGKGKGDRYKRHLNNKKNNIMYNKITKIKKSNLNPIIIKLYNDLYEEKSFEMEKITIEKIGRKNLNFGPLINLTDGGKGSPKCISVRTKEQKQKISQSLKGRKLTEEHKLKVSLNHADVSGSNNPMFGKTHTQESKNKIINANKKYLEKNGGKLPLSTIEKFKERSKGRKNSNYNPTPILQFDLNDNFIKEWSDLYSLKENGLNSKLISRVCRGERKTAFGYKWKFLISS